MREVSKRQICRFCRRERKIRTDFVSPPAALRRHPPRQRGGKNIHQQRGIKHHEKNNKTRRMRNTSRSSSKRSSTWRINKEMKKSFLDYSMAVIVSRALPDVRDGLKPVHRRILYTMYENNLYPEKAYRKCADTVGSVLGRYHPHGDASVYDAMVRLAQSFSMRYMLVDGHGNFGSGRRRPARRIPLYRVAHEQDLHGDAHEYRQGHPSISCPTTTTA